MTALHFQRWQPSSPPVRALYDVVLPRRVVVAGAVGRTLHAAVARVKVAAEAEGEAVGGVVAEELGGRGGDQGLLDGGATGQGLHAAAHPATWRS
jgi:hypothetical protein